MNPPAIAIRLIVVIAVIALAALAVLAWVCRIWEETASPQKKSTQTSARSGPDCALTDDREHNVRLRTPLKRRIS
jgi:hypothetical protein